MASSTADIFDLRHQQEYALEIVARDPADENRVAAVRCLFCVHLGREPAPEGALRQRSQNVRAWRTFHPINFQRHHEGQHATHWKLYQACTPAEKDAFFEKHKKDDLAVSVSAAPVGASTAAAPAAAVGAAGEDAGLAPVKRPRGRPRSNGAASIQWNDEMAQRLLQLRFETYANWFSGESRASKHDGWKLITSALTEEFGMTVDAEQCKNKLRLLKAHTHADGSVAATRPRRTVTVPSAVVSADETKESGAVSVDAPVKRGRGRPRINRDTDSSLIRPAAPSNALPPQKKQRVDNNEVGGGDINTALLRSILRSTEEQRDALAAQRAATEAQTASIQELLQLLKARGIETTLKPVVTTSELV